MQASAAGGRLRLRTPLGAELRPGDSLAVNGVCLTVTQQDAEMLSADVSPATLAITTLGQLGPGRVVNLERPVRADARMGGHFVLGHVDGVGRVAVLRQDGEAWWLEVEIPASVQALVIPKGSITIDGISLTVAAIDAETIAVQIVPFTFAHTALAQAGVGDPVNIEADVLGKYVVRLFERMGAPGLPAVPGFGSL